MDKKTRHIQPEDSWEMLAQLSQNGDKRSYNILLKQIASFAQGYIVGTVFSRDWAEDIVQEVLISVHRSLHTYSADRPFKPWLISIIHFRKTDYLRKHYRARDDRKTALDEKNFITEHVTNPVSAGEYKDIETALEELPEKQREVFRRVKIEGYTAKEVAVQLGMTESAVKVSAHRTMNKLKDSLG